MSGSLLASERTRMAGSLWWSAAHNSMIDRRSTSQAAAASAGFASLIVMPMGRENTTMSTGIALIPARNLSST
jgi:hypothetical protein